MDNKLEEDILQMIEHAQNNVDNGGSFSQYVKLIGRLACPYLGNRTRLLALCPSTCFQRRSYSRHIQPF